MSDLSDAKQLQVYRKSDHPTMQTNGIWNEVLSLRAERARRAERKFQVRKPDRIKRFLDALILDLWVAATYEDNPWRSIARDKGEYRNQTRYRKLFFKYDLFVPLLDDLISLGYVKQQIGFYNPATGQGMRTRIRSTNKLLDLCTEWDIAHVFRAADVPEDETIRLVSEKDGDEKTKLLDYEDTRQTIQMRNLLTQINRKLEESVITVPGVKADTSAKRLHRVFNDGSWRHGGRFYGGFWETLSQRERKPDEPEDKDTKQREKILIDSQSCCELDFKATHATMVYNLMGLPAPEDSYAIPGFDRETVKKAFIVLFNCISREDTLNAMSHGMKIRKSANLLAAIEAAHPDIAPGFHKRTVGMKLQMVDSLIATGVMRDMYRQGIVCLPNHDSFIVQRQHEHALRTAMNKWWLNLLRQTPVIDNKY